MNPRANQKYLSLRALLLQRGYTLRRFAKRFGFAQRTVYAAARGDRNGLKSARILKKIGQITDGN
jgi:transcriptional regulator with XRE-family HTH domain